MSETIIFPLATTLNRIHKSDPCDTCWIKLLKGLDKTGPDDEPLNYAEIIKINGFDDALWWAKVEPRYDSLWRLYAVKCVRRVEHLLHDPSSLNALKVAERHARGQASDEELELAQHDAAMAWFAALRKETTAAACAARAVWEVTGPRALEGARAREAVRSARWAAWEAATTPEKDAAWRAEEEVQAELFKQLVNGKLFGANLNEIKRVQS